jgi:hypothetical protein
MLPTLAVAEKVTFPEPQTELGATDAEIVGTVLSTVTVTWSVLKQPVTSLVFVTVYIVVTSGLAVGLLIIAELNPVDGLHE